MNMHQSKFQMAPLASSKYIACSETEKFPNMLGKFSRKNYKSLRRDCEILITNSAHEYIDKYDQLTAPIKLYAKRCSNGS